MYIVYQHLFINFLLFVLKGINEGIDHAVVDYRKRNFLTVIFSYASWYFLVVSVITSAGRRGGAEFLSHPVEIK